jgi:hypothetical protein
MTLDFSAEPTDTERQPIDSRSYVEEDWPRQRPVYFVFDDGGRSQSKRPKQKNDCTVRALAIACEITYDEAYEMLAAAGRSCSRGFAPFSRWAQKEPGLEWTPFPAVKGRRRMNPTKFCHLFRQGAGSPALLSMSFLSSTALFTMKHRQIRVAADTVPGECAANERLAVTNTRTVEEIVRCSYSPFELHAIEKFWFLDIINGGHL